MRGKQLVWITSLIALFSLLRGASLGRAQELPDLERPAEIAQRGVATVRILDEMPDADSAAPEATKSRVTVCTGVCVEQGWIVTPAFAGSDSQIRLTLAGGDQSTGTLRVIDEYSGLALVQCDTKDLKPLKPASGEPKVGAWVLSAAAWGIEKPIISFGNLSGVGRAAGGLQFPPLLQADLRTTETSGGSALVNRDGDLLGIVVLADEAKDQRGFSFAVPVAHVQRLLRARITAKPGEKNTSVVVLKRRRPVVGMVLEAADARADRFVITRIIPDGPADKAGLKKGDVIVAIDGIRIRTVTQASLLVMQRQPGDVMTYDVQEGDKVRRVEVVLAGGVVFPAAPAELLSEYIRPKIDIEGLGQGRSVVRSSIGGNIREVAAPGDAATPAGDERQLQSPLAQVKLLQTALDRYQAVITLLHQQLAERDQERRATDGRVKQLETEVERLKAMMKIP
jgi:S1-C subfamily serine protease